MLFWVPGVQTGACLDSTVGAAVARAKTEDAARARKLKVTILDIFVSKSENCMSNFKSELLSSTF